MVETAPTSVDLQEFQFKLHSKLKIFDNIDDSKFTNAYNLVTAASRFGLIFVGTPNATLEVVQLKTIENTSITKVESANFPKRSVPLPGNPSHLSLSCDQTLLAVVCYKNDCATSIIYTVTSFLSQNVVLYRDIRLSATPGVTVQEAGWNPTVAGAFTACKTDGSLGVFNIGETSVDINELPVAAAARCFCWSPKGKQLVVGSTNGSLTQYKPDLKAVKVTGVPALGGRGPYCVLSVCWVSNYQFTAVYRDAGDEESRPTIILVNASKAGPVTFINYDDICFSFGSLRPPQYYIIHQPTWGVMIVASANSMEVGVLGMNSSSDPAVWIQWNQIDAARAELPLSSAHQETFPIGIALDTGVATHLQTENQTLPPMPFLHLLSHRGVLCSFSVINIRAGVAVICAPPETVPDQSGLRFFVTPVAPQNVTMKPETIPTSMFNISTPNPVSVSTPIAPNPGNGLIRPIAQSSSLFSGIAISLPQSQPMQPQPGALFGVKPLFQQSGALFGQGFSSQQVQPPQQHQQQLQQSTLFGGLGSVSAPSFGSIATAAPTTAFSLKLPTTETTSTKVTTASTTPSLFGSLSAALPPTTKPAANSTFSLPISSPPKFDSLPQFASKQSAAVHHTVTSTGSPVTRPLLSTPKQPAKPDVINVSAQIKQPVDTSANNETLTKKDESVINDQIIQSLIKDEVKNFQSELHELFQRCKTIKIDVGSEEEKNTLVLTTESLLEFYKELQDITDSQVTEVHYLKQALMQSFAWYEDSKARHRRYNDPHFTSLLQKQELDPVSEKQFADIKHLIYYIEAQLKQVDGFLDNQWADFQDSCKKHVKGRLQIPTLEPIYQAMVKQNAILDRHKYLLKDIAARIKSRNKKAAAYPHVMNKSLQNKETIEINEELRKLKLDPGDLFAVRYDKILTVEKKFTETKQTKLCAFFTNRNVVHIAPRKPKFVNSLLMSPPKLTLTYASPGVQRNLSQTFDKVDTSFNNSIVEANLSSSNLFSFSLLDGSHGVKSRTPEKCTVPQQKTATALLFDTPKSSAAFVKPMNVSSPVSTKISTNLFHTTSTGTTIVSSTPVFTFTATSTSIVQSKPLNFASGDSNTTVIQSGSNFAPGIKFELPQLQTKPNEREAKEFPIVSKPMEITCVNKSAAEKTTVETKSIQQFSFVVPQPRTTNVTTTITKSTNVANYPVTTNLANSSIIAGSKTGSNSVFPPSRDSIGPNFNFGNALNLGQQSTPKPKSTATLAQVSIISTAVVTTSKPITTVAAVIVTTSPMSGQIVTPKPTFAAVLPSVTTVTTSATDFQTPAVIEPHKPEIVMPSTPTASATPNIFGGLSNKSPITTPTNKVTSIAPVPTAVSSENLFGSVQPASTVSFDSIFGGILSQTSEKISPTVLTTPAVASGDMYTAPVTTSSSGFSFVQSKEAYPSSKPSTIFGSSVITPVSSASLFGGITTSIGSTTSGSSTFSFLQSGATIASASSLVTTPILNVPKISSVFSLAENKTAETSSSIPTSTVVVSSPSSFSFGGLTAVDTTTNNDIKFSFGNLTVSALSPSMVTSAATTASSTTTTISTATITTTTTTTITTTSTTTTTTGFSFALSDSVISTTPTTNSGFGFGSNLFGKPATTTVTANFIGQPICSPSTFNQQNSSPVFGQNSGNIFAQNTSTSSAGTGSIFGQNTGSIFGSTINPTVTSSSTSPIFGQTQNLPFGTPVSGTSTSGGSIFGQSSGFGTPTTTSGSIFGQSTFGSPAKTSAGNFSFTQNTNSTGFGNSGGSIFGAKPSFGQTSAFGQPASFGSPSAFGVNSASGGNVFGNPSASSSGNTFGNGFGSPTTFGQKPTFGSPPGFGQSAFGSPPSFGNSPGFGSPQRVFGSTASPSTGTFGSAMQENSTFANLANQPTLGFGNLVQNQQNTQQQQQSPQFSGGSSFSSWR